MVPTFVVGDVVFGVLCHLANESYKGNLRYEPVRSGEREREKARESESRGRGVAEGGETDHCETSKSL